MEVQKKHFIAIFIPICESFESPPKFGLSFFL